MKKTIFSSFLVILFTVFFTNQSFAGSGLLSINGQDTKKPGAVVATPQQAVDLLFHNKPIPGVQYYDACDESCFKNNIAIFTAVGRQGVYSILNDINTETGGALLSQSGKIVLFTENNKQESEKILRKFLVNKQLSFSETIELGGVKNDLQGGSGYLTKVNHVGVFGILVLPGSLGSYPIYDASCINYGNKKVTMALKTGIAKVGTTVSTPGATTVAGGGVTPEQQKIIDNVLSSTGNSGGNLIIINAPSATATGGTATNTNTNHTPAMNQTQTPDRYKPGTVREEYRPVANQHVGTRTTTNTTTSSNQGIACNTCPSANNNGAWNRQDVAHVENQMSQQTALQQKMVKQNRVGNAFAGITAVGTVAHLVYDVVTDVKGPNGRWVPQQYGGGNTSWGGANWNNTNNGTGGGNTNWGGDIW